MFKNPRCILLAGTALIVGIVVLLIVLTSLNDRRQSVDEVHEDGARITDSVANAIRSSYGKACLLLDQIVDDYPTSGAAHDAQRRFGDKLDRITTRHKEITLAGVLDADGGAIGRFHPALKPDARRAARTAEGAPSPAAGQTEVGTPFFDAASSQWTLPLYRELFDVRGRRLGTAVVGISLEVLREEFDKLGRAGDSRILLMDADGVVLARHPGHTGTMQVNPHTPRNALSDYIDRHDAGAIEAPSPFDGVVRQYTFRHVASSPLVVVFGETVEGQLGHWRNRMYWRLALLAWILAALGGAAFYIDVLIRRSVHSRLALEEAMARASSIEFALHRHAMLTRTDTSDRIIVNESFCERSGYSREELLGQTHKIINSGAHSDDFFRELHETINAGKVWSGDICNRTRNKDLFWTRTTIVPLKNAAGAITEFIALRTDISELKFMQRQIEVANDSLAASFDLLYATINSSTSGIMTTSLDGIVVMMNTAAEHLLGYSQYEAENELSMLRVHDAAQVRQALLDAKADPDAAPEAICAALARIITDNPEREWTFLTKAGRKTPVRVMTSPMYGRNGRLQGYVTSFNDLTRLKEVEMMKSDFVSMVSHELRTPLTSIKGALTLLDMMAGKALPDNQRQLLGIAFENCENLVKLVSDILDFEKVSRNEITYEMARQDMGALVEKAVAMTQPYANQFNVRYVVSNEQGELPVHADQPRLVQVIVNLLSNAAKFSHAGSDVTVSAHTDGTSVEVQVTDCGVGIPAAFQSKIFERFSQVDHGSRPTKVKGTGLGLSIAKMMVEAHGGSIGFRSTEAVGTTFFVRLPMAAEHVAADPMAFS